MRRLSSYLPMILLFAALPAPAATTSAPATTTHSQITAPATTASQTLADQPPPSVEPVAEHLGLSLSDLRKVIPDLPLPLTENADVTSGAIKTTDAATRIQQLVRIIQELHARNIPLPQKWRRRLTYSNPADVARLLNAKFAPPSTPDPNAATPPVRFLAEVDTATNAVIITGPAEQVHQALELIDSVEAANPAFFFIPEARKPQPIQPILERIFGPASTPPTTTAPATTPARRVR